jgi:hypothetical protein
MSAESRVPRAPAGLKAAGRALWRGILGDLAEGWELDCRELLVLEAAARQADLNRALERALDEDGLIVSGSMGQARLNAAATELRQGRLAVERLLASLALPGDGDTETQQQRRSRAAAEARWGGNPRRRARRGAA